MPNIILVGFNGSVIDNLGLSVTNVVKGLGLEGDSVVTFLNSTVRRCSDGKPEPYAIVRCDNSQHLNDVSKGINEILGLAVEKELIQGFLPPDLTRVWNREGR